MLDLEVRKGEAAGRKVEFVGTSLQFETERVILSGKTWSSEELHELGVVDLLAEFPDARINPGEPEINVPDNFYVSNVFFGLLTGTQQDDVVTVILAGDGCGE